MKQEMELFERHFAEALSGAVLPMDEIMRCVGAVAGKRLRPSLVFMSAQLFGEVNESTRRTALFVELLHTASLIHDDVVDESDTRRGQPSVNARWNNKAAVLAGDYLLSKAICLLSDPSDHLILKEMLDVAMAMSEGELMQLKVKRGATETTEAYLDIITRKTARLIQACCTCGALSVVNANFPLSTLPPIRSVSPSGFHFPFPIPSLHNELEIHLTLQQVDILHHHLHLVAQLKHTT